MTRHRTAAVACAALLPCLVLVAGKYPLDLDVYRAGGRAVLDGAALYDVRLHGYGFTYPPFAALLFTGWAALPLPVATVLATAASLAALAWVLRVSCHGLLSRGTAEVVLVAGFAACAPVRWTMWNGQVNLLLAALVLADVLGVTPRRGRGVLVGAAAAIKLTPAIFAVHLLLSGRVADARRAATAFVALTALGFAVLPGDSLRFWTHEVFAGSGIGDPARTANQSLRGMALRLVGPAAAGPIWLLACVPVAVVGLRLALRVADPVLACGIVGLVGVLVSPVSWGHHWIWVIPCLAGLVRTRGVRPSVVALWLLALGLDLLQQPAVVEALPASAWLVGNAFVWAALVAGAIGWRSVSRPASRAVPPALHSVAPAEKLPRLDSNQ